MDTIQILNSTQATVSPSFLFFFFFFFSSSSFLLLLSAPSLEQRMDQDDSRISTKAYDDELHDGNCRSVSYPCSPRSSTHTHGRKRRAVASGVQKALSKTSMLANFLPTGTLLTFEMILPSVSGDGSCSPVSTSMIHTLLALCALSCFFFHFTDSFRGPDGKIYYGFVTPRGLAVFKTGLGVEVPREERFRAGFVDVVHAFMSVMVFASIAFSDHRVTNCLFPGHAKEMDEVMESFPLMVGVVCSGLFLVFPNTRSGIGCMAT